MRAEGLCLVAMALILLSPLGSQAFQVIRHSLAFKPRRLQDDQSTAVTRLRAKIESSEADLEFLHGAVCKAIQWEREKSLPPALVEDLSVVDVRVEGLAGESVLLSRPLSKLLAKKMLLVESSGHWPPLPSIIGLVEVDESEQQEEWKKSTNKQMKEWRDRQNDSLGKFAFYKDAPIRDLVAALGPRGVLSLLGMRKTAGSGLSLPPTASVLIESFNTKHVISKLMDLLHSDLSMFNAFFRPAGRSRAARGFLCPWVRERWPSMQFEAQMGIVYSTRTDLPQLWMENLMTDFLSVGRFWGEATGNDKAKNELADRKVREIMQAATWINIHGIPDRGDEQQVLEIRVTEGYGARWAIVGNELAFRGFLEPMMEDGHEKGWRH